MEIISFDPENRCYRDKFIRFPFELYRDNDYWVPPVLMDHRTIFQPNRHGFYEHGKANFLLAMDGDKPIGRLVVLYNNELDLDRKNDIANFFLFESIEDKSVAQGLFDRAMEW